MMIEPGRLLSRICSSYVTTWSLLLIPGSIRTLAPVPMIRLSNVYDVLVPSLSTSTSLAPLMVPQPSISVILFFFIRKCTPLALESATPRLRLWVTPKSIEASPLMPKTSFSLVMMWAISALRSSAFEGMQPTLRQTPPQYFSSMTATD